MARSTNNEIQLALDRALDGLAVVEAVETKDDVARVLIRGRTRNYRLRALWAGAGWPADVDRAIRHLDEEWPPDLLVVARNLSAGSRAMLDRRGASWVDGSGDAHIVARDLLVMREVEQQPGTERRAFSWSPSAVSIAEALLNRNSPYGVRATELAVLTGWSTPQISQVLGTFDAEGWTTKWGPQRGPGASREVTDGARMLDAWAEEVSAVKPERRFAERIFNDPMKFLVDELGPALDNHNIGWAVTGWAAAEQLAPFATAVPALQVYIEERALWGPLSLAMQDIPVRWVEPGGRIEFRSADSHLLELATRRNGIPLVTAPRVFADLQALGGRGEDAAMHVREEVILNNLRLRQRRTTPSAEMDAWDKRCRDRLKKRITDELGDVETVYDSGTWSVSYWIPDVTMPLGELRDALVEVEGRETGWPPWWVPTREGIQPEIQQGGIECWFREDAVRNGRHPDFWRAEPALKLFLLRDYQEDGITRAPGSALDPVFTVWRMAESLLHSARMARYVNAEDIEFFTRWDGLENRELRAIESDLWDFKPGHVAHDDSIATFVHTSPEEIDRDLPSVVRALVSSLFEVFGLFDPPGSLYATEIATMLKRSRGQTGG